MYDADRLPSAIDIGFTGETNFRKVEIDMSAWIEEMYEGVAGIAYRKPGEETVHYPEVSMENGILTWTIREEDLGTFGGTGKIQLVMTEYDGATAVKVRRGKITDVRIHKGIMR
jgi:hypothetical protein